MSGRATCRICWGTASSGPGGRLVAPCRCTGSVRHVHEGCLAQWRVGPPARTHCEICHTRFRMPAGPGALLAGAAQAAWCVVRLVWPAALLAAAAWQGVQWGARAAVGPEQRQRERERLREDRAQQRRQRQCVARQRWQQKRREWQRRQQERRLQQNRQEQQQDMDAVGAVKLAWAATQVLLAAGKAGRPR
ncbi:hypothetical protein ABPG75_000285 [Micractinium tetrahymenae]